MPPRQETKENSVLVSLKGLREIEEDRLAQEAEAQLARQRRAEEAARQAAREEQEQLERRRLEEQERQRRAREQKDQDEREARLRAQEAERRARVEAELALERLRLARQAPPPAASRRGAAAVVVAAAILISGGAVTWAFTRGGQPERWSQEKHRLQQEVIRLRAGLADTTRAYEEIVERLREKRAAPGDQQRPRGVGPEPRPPRHAAGPAASGKPRPAARPRPRPAGRRGPGGGPAELADECRGSEDPLCGILEQDPRAGSRRPRARP